MTKPLLLSKANGISSGIANIIPLVLASDLVNSVGNGKAKSISCVQFNGKSNGKGNRETASTFSLYVNAYNDGNLLAIYGSDIKMALYLVNFHHFWEIEEDLKKI